MSSLAKAIKEAFQRYDVQGSLRTMRRYSDDAVTHIEKGSPWLVIDVSTAEDDSGWPGELMSEHDTAGEAWDAVWELVASDVATFVSKVINDG